MMPNRNPKRQRGRRGTRAHSGRLLQIENCKLKTANWKASPRQFAICSFQFSICNSIIAAIAGACSSSPSLTLRAGVLLFCLIPTLLPAQTKSDEEQSLPKFADLEIPTADELLRGKPVDWVVLLNGDVLIVESVPYRPNTLKTLQQQYDEVLKAKPGTMSTEEKTKKMHDLRRLQVTLINGGEEPDYLLETRFIDRIVYFEDLVLKRASLLMDDRQLPAAFELLMFLDRRHRGWPGFDAHYHRYLFLEATRLQTNGQLEAALVQLERLFALEPKYPQASEQLGAVIDQLITKAWDENDNRRARFFLARIDRLNAEHPVAQRWRERMTTEAGNTLMSARTASAAKNYREAVDLADRAARIWPELTGLKEAHRDLTARYQVVHTGVVRLPAVKTALDLGDADNERQRLLCEIPLFEPDRLQDSSVRYHSAYIESWEPRDLGRELQFQMRLRRAAWESRPVLTAGMIADSLEARRRLGSASGDDRWSANVRGIHADSPWDWRLTLSQTPLRVEGWLRVTVPLTEAAQSWNPDIQPAVWNAPEQQRFFVSERNEDEVVFQRTRPEADNVPQRHVNEIREHRYADWDHLLQGLNRGEFDFAPVAEWRDLSALQQDNRFFVQQYALPRTHVLLINPHSVAAVNGPLRRALIHALPREDLLKQQVLEGADAAWGRIVTSPFATNTYAYDSRLPHPEYSPGLARSLAETAKKELKDELPVLKLRPPGNAAALRALPEMVAAWKRIGIDVEVLPDRSDSAGWDLMYATVRLTEPYVDIWNLIGINGPAGWDTLQIYPHWLRQELLDLERTVDWTAAVRLLQRIEAEFLVEARWLPLWEVDEYLVARKRINGFVFPQRAPLSTYQNIERWVVNTWYPNDVP